MLAGISFPITLSYLFNYAHEINYRPHVHVMLLASQYKRFGYNNVQINEVR